MWFQWKFFKKIDKNPHIDIFRSIRGQKGPTYLTHRGHFTHTLRSTYIMPVNHVLRSGNKNFWENGKKLRNCLFWPIFCNKKSITKIWTHLQKSSNVLKKIKFSVIPGENSQENRRKPRYWHISALFGAKKAPKIWPTGIIFHTHL